MRDVESHRVINILVLKTVSESNKKEGVGALDDRAGRTEICRQP